MGLAIIGPTLPDLKNRLNVQYNELSTALAAMNVGLVFGGIAAGLILDRVRHQGIFLAAGSALRAAALGAIPWSPNLYVLIALFLLQSFGGGFAETGD